MIISKHNLYLTNSEIILISEKNMKHQSFGSKNVLHRRQITQTMSRSVELTLVFFKLYMSIFNLKVRNIPSPSKIKFVSYYFLPWRRKTPGLRKATLRSWNAIFFWINSPQQSVISDFSGSTIPTITSSSVNDILLLFQIKLQAK